MTALEWCEQNNIEPDDLDGFVHEAASFVEPNRS
jgi:hypothetical protein